MASRSPCGDFIAMIQFRANWHAVCCASFYWRNEGKEPAMPEKETIQRAHPDKRAGKSASTQASEFVREEIHHICEGKHRARSTKQAIAIAWSKAWRAVDNLK